MGGTIACLAVLENQENLSGLILESAAIEMHPKTASWTVRTAAMRRIAMTSGERGISGNQRDARCAKRVTRGEGKASG